MEASARYQKKISDIVWKNNRSSIAYNLNTAIFPYLVQESLLSERALEKYADQKSLEYQKKDLLVSAVPRCGHDDYLIKFIQCLRSSAEEAGKAHNELAEQLEKDFQEMLASRVSLTEESISTTIYDPEMGSTIHKESISSIVTISSSERLTPEGCSVRGGRLPRHHSIHHYKRQKKFDKTKAKEIGKRICVHTLALVWLLLGAIATVVLYYYPKHGATAPIEVKCGQTPTMSLNLGVDPYWLSSADVSFLDNNGRTSTVYLANISCENAPTFTFAQTDIGLPPYYLVKGSNWTAVNRKPEEVTFWFVKSQPLSCDNVNELSCNDNEDSDKTCQTVKPGETTMTFVANESDYYNICPRSIYLNNYINFTNIAYNGSAIMSNNMVSKHQMSSDPPTVSVPLMKPFDFEQREMCLFMDLKCEQASISSLKIKAHMREDIMTLTMLLALFLSVTHLAISLVIHACHSRRFVVVQQKKKKDLAPLI